MEKKRPKTQANRKPKQAGVPASTTSQPAKKAKLEAQPQSNEVEDAVSTDFYLKMEMKTEDVKDQPSNEIEDAVSTDFYIKMEMKTEAATQLL